MTARLDFQSIMLLVVLGLFSLANALSGAFVNVFLWKATSDYSLIGWLAFSQQLSIGLSVYCAGKWVKEGNKMNCLRLGIGLAGAFYAAVLWLGQGAVHYIWVLGLLLGAAFGTFWLAFNVLYFEVTNPDSRDLFNGWVGLISSFCGMLAPWTSGLLISSLGHGTGYQVIFTVSFCVFIGAIVLSFWLHRRPPEGHYNWMLPFTEWSQPRSPWRSVLPALASQGVRDGVFAFLIGLVVYIATTNELKLGYYTLITNAVALVSFYIAGRVLRPSFRASGMFLGTIVMAFSVIPLFFGIGYGSLLLCGIITSLFLPLFVIPMTTVTFDMIGVNEQAASQRVELTVLREFGLLIGRIVGISAYLLVVQWKTVDTVVIIFLAIIGASPIMSTLCMRFLFNTQINK